MSLNWDDLKVALAIKRGGSITRAAELLGMDQSTAGRRLAALEAATGTVLFVRARTGLTPTEAGETVIARGQEIEIRLDRMAEQIGEAGKGPAGTVRLVGNLWILDTLTKNSMAGFLSEHPRLDLRMVSLTPKLPTRGDATLSLWFEKQPTEMEFGIKLGAVPYGIYKKKGLNGAKLDWVSFLDEDTPRLAPTRTLEKLRRKGERVRMTGTDAHMLVSAVAGGIGKGLLPMCLAERHPGLERLENGHPEMTRILNLHMHPDTVQTLRVQAVIRWLRSCFEDCFGGGAGVGTSGDGARK